MRSSLGHPFLRLGPPGSPNLRAGTPAPSLRRSRLGQLIVVPDDREVDVLQRRHLPHLDLRLQAGAPAELRELTDVEREPAGHDADLPGEVLRLLHAVRADHQRAAILLETFEIDPRA